MNRTAVLVTALLSILISCWLPPPATPPLVESGAPPEIRSACDLTARKCTRCHTLDRIRLAQVSTPTQWENYVARMRRNPGSGIAPEDGDVIVRCLVYRSFGGPP